MASYITGNAPQITQAAPTGGGDPTITDLWKLYVRACRMYCMWKASGKVEGSAEFNEFLAQIGTSEPGLRT